MAILALVLFWLLVGLAVFAAAMRAGPKRGPRTWRSERRGLFVASVAVFVVFGIALPAVVLGLGGIHKAKSARGGVELNADQANGRMLFYRNCGTCHTLAAANTVGKVGPNLDVLRPNQALLLNAIAKGRARGVGQMPAQLLQGQEARDVASFVARVAGH